MKANFMDRPLWVYEVYIPQEGEDGTIKMSVEKVDVKGWRLWHGEPVFVDVEGRHEGISASQFEMVLSTDNKRIKKIWLEDRNDRLALHIINHYYEDLIDYYFERVVRLKELLGMTKGLKVELLNE